jgi:hypothetical protein
VGVVLGEHPRRDGLADRVEDLLPAGPNVPQVDRLAIRVLAQRLAVQVDVDGAGKGVSDDQRRRREVLGADHRVDATLEVAVAAQDGGGDQIVLLHRGADGLQHQAAVADAGGAAVTDKVEA